VLTDEKSISVKNKKANIDDVKRYKAFIYADVGFFGADMYLPPLWNKIQTSIILQSNIFHTAQKTAICLSQIAVFLLTKYLYFRLKIACFDAFAKLVGCRSPPLVLHFSDSKI